MLRAANITDFDFINKIVLSESKKGHFNRKLVRLINKFFWKRELRSILSKDSRNKGIYAKAYVWVRDDNPIGFVIMSVLTKDNKGNELWMSAITPEQRGLGEGKKMLITILEQFKGKNKTLVARCSVESEAMFHILTTNGFIKADEIENETRLLKYKL